MNSIWLVDDDESILNKLNSILTREGYGVRLFNRPESLIDALKSDSPGVIIIDIFFNNSRLTGEDLVLHIGENNPLTQTVVMSGETDIKKTLGCLNKGALDFLEKPVSLTRLLTSVKNAFNLYNTRVISEKQFNILGESRIIKDTIKKIRKLSQINETVLIYGESGTGKEMAARNLHLFSKRYSRDLSIVNSAALNPNLIESELFGHKKGSFTGAIENKTGYFQRSDKGSLFIDEIGDFPIELQAKLLRVLQEKRITPVGSSEEIEIDTRLIFATHQNLKDLINKKLFREDLYFRISTFSVTMPPLRERLEDVKILSDHFLTKFISENSLPYRLFSNEAIDKLLTYSYPGNIRELSQIVKNAAFFSNSEIIKPEDIEFSSSKKESIWEVTNQMTLTEGKKYFEKEFIKRRLTSMSNHIEKSADSLGMVKNNLYRKLKEHGLRK